MPETGYNLTEGEARLPGGASPKNAQGRADGRAPHAHAELSRDGLAPGGRDHRDFEQARPAGQVTTRATEGLLRSAQVSDLAETRDRRSPLESSPSVYHG